MYTNIYMFICERNCAQKEIILCILLRRILNLTRFYYIRNIWYNENGELRNDIETNVLLTRVINPCVTKLIIESQRVIQSFLEAQHYLMYVSPRLYEETYDVIQK